MHALVRFSYIAQNTFTTSEIYADTLAALAVSPSNYSLASLRYDLSKLRARGLVEKVPRSRRYRLLREGYSICLVFRKLFERIYAPLTAGLLSPIPGDSKLQHQKRCQLNRP
jgi:DNA-binding transcriptional ArsR family regulator